MGSEEGAIKPQDNVSAAFRFLKAPDWHRSKLLSSRMVWNILEEPILQIAERQAVRQ